MVSRLFAEKFTSHLKQALLRAQSLAANEITVDNLLDALAREKGCIAAEIINKARRIKIETDIEEAPLAEGLPLILDKNRVIALNAEANAGLVKAIQISQQYGHQYIGTEHLLKSLHSLPSKSVSAWLARQAVSSAEIEKNLHIVLESTSKFPDLTAVFRVAKENAETREDKLQATLEYFGRELTNLKVQKDIDPVIGRAAEISRLVHVLCRRYKNNPLLLGEAGVGKTAIVEGLAKKIALGDVPPILANKKIFTIDLGSIVAGTIYRGEFEARFKNLIEAAEQNGNTILFIDEIHTIMGAGSASGSLDAANMLKPALARGKVSIIGATTLDEYKKHIEPDSALERRLQPILVEEPSESETIEVLTGIKGNYEKFHNVSIDASAVTTAVKLSNRYITDKLQPDKAIDLIDEASSRVKVERSQKAIWQAIRQLETDLAQAKTNKRQAVAQEDYVQAIKLKQVEAELNAELARLLTEAKNDDSQQTPVTARHILQVVSSLTKIPLGELAQDERLALVDLELKLQARIIGQNEALGQIANLIRRSRTEVADPKKPLASFIFLGPSGVGKTETAKQLAQILFNDPKALIKVDMSEFAEGFTVSRLIGAPAGYVGYRDSNKFTDLVRRRPHSVVLLDEIEKAHPEVFNILLQVLEDGHLTDATGRFINFRNTIIIMTSNLGLAEFNQAAKLGFGLSEENPAFTDISKRVHRDLSNHFRPEFLNRIDNVAIFKPLNKDSLLAIVGLYLTELNRRLRDKNINLLLTPAASGHIITTAYAPDQGARGVRRFFQDQIEGKLANMILAEPLRNQAITIDLDNAKTGLDFKLDSRLI
ncbi:MAG: ATP-dependent Clp protease ATP-binding subunit [Patescibacteria group bacterium]